MTDTWQREGARGVRAAAAVTVAATTVNALAYAVPLIGARRLSADDLGALAAALAVGALAAIVGLGLQTAVAVHRAKHGAVDARRVTAVTAALTGGALLLATPLLTATLHLSARLPGLLGLTTVAVVLGSRWLGELQGAQRFQALAWGIALQGIGRYCGVLIGLAAGAGVVGSMATGAAVAWLALAPLAALARAKTRDEPVPAVGGPEGWSLGRAVLVASGASLAMLAVSYADLILARHFLSAADSGAYAVGSMLTKGALWAPAVVTVIALPRLARGGGQAMRIAVAAVTACGAVLVGGTAFAGTLAIGLSGGPGYESLAGYAPIFAAVGALYALSFVFVNARIATGVRWPAAPLWIALAGLVIAVTLNTPQTVGGIVLRALVAAAGATGIMAALALGRRVTGR